MKTIVHTSNEDQELDDGKVKIGKKTYVMGGLNTDFYGPGLLEIGRYCSISDGVQFLVQAEHRIDTVSTYPFIQAKSSYSKGPIKIGHDVWIGRDAIILSGVTIYTGAVIGAGAVVARDVPPYAVMVGNPARLCRYRFPVCEIKRLLEEAWWDWDDEKIQSNLSYLTERNNEKASPNHSGN